MSVYDTQSEENRDESLQAAVDAVREGRLIVLPTDTVYGIGADAFDPAAVQSLLDAKGRGRSVPPPVLVGDTSVLLALAVDVPDYAETLAEEFWPGALTLILHAQPTLSWDLGETKGTVALRMPDDPTALELLRRTGPLAVSSANRHGKPAATTVLDAASQLGDSVEVYLDGGTARLGTSSTILDTTVEPAEILREGAITREQIIEAIGDIFAEPEPEDVPESEVETAPEAGTSTDADADGDASADSDASADGDAAPTEALGDLAAEAGDLENPEEPEAPADPAAVDPEAPADAAEIDPEATADAPAADPEAPADAPALDPAAPAGATALDEAPAGDAASDAARAGGAAHETAPAGETTPSTVDAGTGGTPATGSSHVAGEPATAPTPGPLALPSEADAAPTTEGRIG